MNSDTCEHDSFYLNCTKCIVKKQEENGIRAHGVLHSDNGAGWCVGHRTGPGDGRCTVLVRHCTVLNTVDEVAKNRREDAQIEVQKATARVKSARLALEEANKALSKAAREERLLILEAVPTSHQ